MRVASSLSAIAIGLLATLACESKGEVIEPVEPEAAAVLAPVESATEIAAPEPAPSDPQPASPPDPFGPLDPELAARLAAIEPDPEPSALINSSHYWTSNESSHFVWYEDLRGIGGTYVGVGADQNYLLAAWAESELLVLMDFDQAIADLHQVYRLCFAAAETPAAFIELWSEDREPELQAMIDEAYTEAGAAAPIANAHRVGRQLISARLRRTARKYAELGIPTFLTDQAQYDHVRKLWANGRVIALRGDLTGDKAMLQLARVLSDADLAVGVLYLSNAEQYFDYGPDFRRNVIALPYTEVSWVLRTLPWDGHGFVEGERFHYNRQGGRNFAGWMRVNRVQTVNKLLARKTATNVAGSSRIDRDADANSRPPDITPVD